LVKKLDLAGGQKDPCHFGQVDFNMSSVIRFYDLKNKDHLMSIYLNNLFLYFYKK
jgi:hypothetical protein